MVHFGQQDNVFLIATGLTALVGAGLLAGGCILRFGNGFGTFADYAKKDNDFMELGRLDIVFGLFTAAACVLILSFFLAFIATYKKNKFLLKTYCAVIALMIVVQLVSGLLAFQYADSVKVLADDSALSASLNRTIPQLQAGQTNTDEINFWDHTQNVFSCCGVINYLDWAPYSSNSTQLRAIGCYENNKMTGCDKQIRSRISSDAQYFGVCSMAVLLVEIVASFLAGYRAYHINYDD